MESTPSSSNLYTPDRHHPLDSSRKEIRLLKVQPGLRDDSVHCHLEHAFLSGEDKPAYETISYVWGDSTCRGPITLDGQQMEISASAAAVLRRMRLPNDTRTVWIDAICINQHDTEERNQQVALMTDIYSNTFRNLVWLGNDDDCVTAQALSSIAAVVEKMRRDSDELRTIAQRLYPNGSFHKIAGALPAQVDWSALASFYSSSWFSRLWVIQEAVLPPYSLCYRGEYEADLRDILQAALFIDHQTLDLDFVSGDVRGARGIVTAAHIAFLADPECGRACLDEDSISLQTLLMNARDSIARDPRDSIYGVLGMFQRLNNLRELPPLLKPTYESTPAEVYRKATKYVVLERGNLEILDYVRHQLEEESVSGFSTWTPRWDRKSDDPQQTAAVFRVREYRADNNQLTDCSDLLHSPSEILSVGGITVGWIDRVVPEIPDDLLRKDVSPGRAIAALNALEDLTKNSSGGARAAVSVVVASALTASLNDAGEYVDETEIQRPYLAFKQYLEETNNFPPEETPSNPTFESPLTRQAISFQQAMRNVSRHRSLFSTSPLYLGLGPETVQSGDALVVLYGSQYPSVLRPLHLSKNEYSFIGQCYVHGIMFGEAVRAQQVAGGENEVFHLR